MAHITAFNTTFAQRRREQQNLVNKLRATGAQADIDLPRIVVIGNQSAGKSSLIEAISGVQVPRDAGTCTKAPIECRLSSSNEPWSCNVSIRWEFGLDGRRLLDVKEECIQEDITAMSQVELALRRAQYWVLNPMEKIVTVRCISLEESKKERQNALKFSGNVICLDISGPEVTDLSFVDLPGIIQNAEKELVNLVEDLVMSYIRTQCIILVAIPMSDDIENQRAVRLAKEVDPQGNRTIGVLTKPDTLTAGAIKVRELWLDIIEDRRYKLKYGYYCTRQLDEDERIQGITSKDARAAEEAFFSQTAPWSSSSYQHRFGIKHLIESLSTHLSQIMDECIPRLAEEIESNLETCEARIAGLTPPISNPPAHIFGLISSFCSKVHLFIQGVSPNTALVQQNRQTYETYKTAIRSTAPRFLPFVDNSSVRSENDILSMLYGEGNTSSNALSPAQENCMYLIDIRKHIQRSLSRELPNNVPYSAKVALIQDFQRNWKALSMDCFSTVYTVLREIAEKLVHDIFHCHPALEPKIRSGITELIASKRDESLKQLDRLLKYESLPYTQNAEILTQITDKFLSKYKNIRMAAQKQSFPVQPPVFSPHGSEFSNGSNDRSPSKPDVKNSKHNDSTFDASSPVFSFSTSAPDTPNPFGKQTNSPFSVFLGPPTPATAFPFKDRNEEAEITERKALESSVLFNLARLGYTGLNAGDLARLNPPDEYEEELELMADVQAFFEISYKRVIDYVPMIIDHEFLFAFSDASQGHLILSLGLLGKDSADKCAAYVAEDNQTKTEREELVSQKNRLVAARKALFDFAL